MGAGAHEAAATSADGHDAVLLRSPADDLEAIIVPSAGMVCASLRHRGEELLGQRAGLAGYLERGKTFGIPLLHPWANRLGADDYVAAGQSVRLPAGSPLVRREEHGLAIHGLLAAWPHWRPEPPQAGADGARVAAELDWSAHPDLLAAFPFAHRARLEHRLAGPRLTVTLTLTATGDQAVPLAFGFHPYLQLPGVPRADWVVELPGREVLDADARGIPTGAATHAAAGRETLGASSFDQGLRGLADGTRFALCGGGRRLEVCFVRGFPAGQLFAPTAADVVCFEPMAAETDALRSGRGLALLAPGASSSASFEVVVTRG